MDLYTSADGVFLDLECNYPEAYKHSDATFRNITAMTSKDRTWDIGANVAVAFVPGNVFIDNVNAYDTYNSLSDTSSIVALRFLPTCVPTESYERHLTLRNLNMSLNNPDKKDSRYSTVSVNGIGGPYTKTVANISNNYYSKMYGAIYSAFYAYCGPNDETTFSDSIFSDFEFRSYFFSAYF